MTAFKQLLIDKKLTDEQAADIFGISERTIRRWKTGKTAAPKTADHTLSDKSLIKKAKSI